jgi:hypothetical protein
MYSAVGAHLPVRPSNVLSENPSQNFHIPRPMGSSIGFVLEGDRESPNPKQLKRIRTILPQIQP